MSVRTFFRCLLCGHVTPHRDGPCGAVEHNRAVHQGIGRFEPTEQIPGRALLKRRYSDGWEDIDLTGADIRIIHAQVTPDTGPWALLITLADGTDFLHGEWASLRTAENKRTELRKIGRTGQ